MTRKDVSPSEEIIDAALNLHTELLLKENQKLHPNWMQKAIEINEYLSILEYSQLIEYYEQDFLV